MLWGQFVICSVTLKTSTFNFIYWELRKEKFIDKLLLIRNEDNVRNFMFDNQMIDKDHHTKWIKNKIKNRSRIFYLVLYKNELIGCVVLSNISNEKKIADWAFYITEKAMRGIGAVLEYKFLNMIFKQEQYNIINCVVLNINKSVLKLHDRFGFKKKNDYKKNFILRNDKKIEFTSLFLDRNNWESEINPFFKDKFIE